MVSGEAGGSGARGAGRRRSSLYAVKMMEGEVGAWKRKDDLEAIRRKRDFRQKKNQIAIVEGVVDAG